MAIPVNIMHYIIQHRFVSVVQLVFSSCNYGGRSILFASQESCHILQADYIDAGCSAF